MDKIIFHLDDSKNLRGGERQVLYLAEELKKKGIVNYIAARENSPLINEARLKVIPNFPLPYFFEWDIISALMLYLKIKKICGKRYKPLIHTHTGHTPAIAFMTSLMLKCPFVVHRRVDFRLNGNVFSKIKYSSPSKIIAISKAIKEILIKDGIPQEKIAVIPSSFSLISPEKIPSMRKKIEKDFSLPKDCFIAGSMIALQPHKDPLNLIRAAEICVKKHKNIFFFLAGEGALRKECENEIRKLKLEDNFKLMGQIDENISFLKSLDIFILPSKEEGLGSVLLEAMSCALPLAATKAGGIPELVEEGINGLLAEKENPVALAEIILKIIENPDIRKKFSEGSLKKSADFSSSAMAEKTIKIYDEIS